MKIKLLLSLLISIFLMGLVSAGTSSFLANVSQDINTATGLSSLTAQRYNATWLDFNGANGMINNNSAFGIVSNTTGQVYSIKFRNLDFCTNSNYCSLFKTGYYEVYLTNTSTLQKAWVAAANLTVGFNNQVWMPLNNDWHVVTVSIVPGNYNTTYSMGLYLDGKSSPYLSSVQLATYPTAVKYNGYKMGNSSGYIFNGSVDEFRVFNASIYGGDMVDIYNEAMGYHTGLQKIPVLMYHKFCQGATSEELCVNSTIFDSQMSYLNASGYQTITDKEYLNWTNNEGFVMPSKAVMLTFDDNYAEIYLNFSTIMNNYGYKGNIVFITKNNGTGALGGALSWANVSTLINTYNWSIIPHSQNHCFLGGGGVGGSTLCNATTQLVGNLTGSWQDIYDNTGYNATTFIFPYNDWGNQVAGTTYTYQIYTEPMNECRKYYSMCFGGESYTATPVYITNESGRYNGDLGRIKMQQTTTLTGFDVIFNQSRGNNSEVVYLRMNENMGTILYDATGNGYNGKINDPTWNTDGKLITLTDTVDYTADFNTGVWQLINSNLDKSYVTLTWSLSSQIDTICSTSDSTFLQAIALVGIIFTIILVGAVLSVLFLSMSGYINLDINIADISLGQIVGAVLIIGFTGLLIATMVYIMSGAYCPALV